MITGSYFNGDNNLPLQNLQHDCYHQALGIITSACIEHYEYASRVRGELDSALSTKLNKIRKGFDHRAMQAAHDYLAAWWRWSFHRIESPLGRIDEHDISEWLIWITEQSAGWCKDHPYLVDHVVDSLLYENTEKGYEAEDKLLSSLKNIYKGMPEKLITATNKEQVIEHWDKWVPDKYEHLPFWKRIWEQEKEAIRTHKREVQRAKDIRKRTNAAHPFISLIKGAAFFILFVCCIGILSIITHFGFSLIGLESPSKITTISDYSIIASSFLFCFSLLPLFGRNKTSTIVNKENKPFLLGGICCLIYALSAALLDIVTEYYLYQPDNHLVMWLLLFTTYTGAALTALYFWAKNCRLTNQ